MATSSASQPLSILFDTWLVSHLVSGLLDDALEASGMSGDDFGMYSLLRAFGPTTPSQIARWTGLRPTTVSATLKRLAGRGHTEQQPNEADRRSYVVGLSEAGRAAHARTARVFWDETRGAAGLIGAQEGALRQALQALDSALREATGLDPRPYRLTRATDQDSWDLRYGGQPLSAAQEAQVRQYIDFLRASSS